MKPKARAPTDPHMLLCESHVKDYIKEAAKYVRPGWIPNRVSDGAIVALNERLKRIIRDCLKKHPTLGTTFKEVI